MKNKLITALLSVVVAIGLWFYVVTVVSPNSDKSFQNVPVILQNEVLLQERGFMVTTTTLPTVALQLEGNRSDLNKLNSSNITIVVDLSRIGQAGTHKLTYTPVYPGDVPANSITVLNQNPSYVTLEIAERISKEIPVNVTYTGTLDESYMADKENMTLDREMVNITGPKQVVDKIAMANLTIDLTNRMESFTEQFEYTLCNADGEPVDAKLVTTDVENITLSLRILRVKEIQLIVEVIDGGGATAQTSQITLDIQSVLVSGNDSLLEGLDTLTVGTINLGEMLADEVITFPIKLPEGVTNETGVHEVNVDVQFPDLEIKELTVTNIQAINVPEGLEVNLITKLLEIQIRGPKKKIDNITPEDITVTVDFANGQVGTATVKADITILAEGVGAVGTYNVTATVRER